MLSLPKLNSSQNGNALLLTLGLIAVVSSVAIEIWNRKELNLSRSRQSTAKIEVDLVVQGFTARLQNPETCTATLEGEVVQPGVGAEVAFHYVFDDSLNPSAAAMGAGSEVVKGIFLNSLQVETTQLEDMRTEILDSNGVPTALVRYPAHLQATFADSKGAFLTIHRTPLFVWANPIDGQILSCFGRNSAGAICNDLGGYFMPNTTPYFLSCRQSIKTERRTVAGLVPSGTCRVGGIQATSKNCNGQYGVPFSGSMVQQTHGQFEPAMTNQFLCELCQ